MPVPEDERRKVFVSYSHKDSDWLKRLQTHLKPLERRGLVELWDDTKIRPGDEWRKEIGDALDSAKVAVLLVSAHFLASDFIAENELPPLLAAAEKDGVLVLPLILMPSLFDETESLSKFQSVNPPSEPLINLPPGKQEEYLVKLSKAVLHVIEEAQKKPARAGGAERLRVFNLPFPRNKYFTGRDDVLSRLHSGFNSGERVQALNGLGGIGKTQTAIEYAYRYRQDYKFVFWGKAHSRESLVADYVAMAELLSLPEKDAEDQAAAASAAKRWFASNGGWLLILDNADDVQIVREFIPADESGHVLLTTRAMNTGTIALRNTVETMKPRDGALFLLRRLKKLREDEPPESAPADLLQQAETLSEAVDGLPLALDQAAAFIEETPSTLEEYQSIYRSECIKLLDKRGDLANGHPESVTVTFSLAFKKVAEANQAAADLLRLCAFLDADEIPEEIFSGGLDELGKALSAAATNLIDLTKAIKDAGRFSLLQRNPETRTVSLHRLVQAVIKDEMNKGIQKIWAERAVRSVNRIFPEVERVIDWQLCDRLIPHAQSIAGLINEFRFKFLNAARLMQKAGIYLCQRAQYAEAEPFLASAQALFEKKLGPKHQNVAPSLNSLAGVYYNQGKYEEAEPLFKRALAILKSHPEDPNFPSCLSNLALLYGDQGRYMEAEQLYKRALSIFEKAHSEHSDRAACLNNFANLYFYQDKCAEAEPLYKRALAVREKVLGSEHPDVATSLNNLASFYFYQDKHAEAEPLYKRALAVREKSLWPEHPGVAISLNSLASLYFYQGKYAEAEPLNRRALAIYEKVLGAEHLDVATSLNNLARLYDIRGKYAEAEPLYQRALAIREKVLGTEHPDVATSLNDLANLYKHQGNYAEAEPLFLRALDIREKVFGVEHPDVATSLNNLAGLYNIQGKYAEAESPFLRALAIREKVLGAEHPDVAYSLNDLARLYNNQGKYAEAEPLFLRALAIFEKVLGAEHPSVATSLNNLAERYRNQGKYDEAEPLFLQALAILEKVLGAEHPWVATTLNNLAALYRNQGKYDEAESPFLRALAIREKVLGVEHPDVANSLNNLARLYNNQGKYAEAEPLFLRALAIFEKVLGAEHPSVATSLNNLAELYRIQGKYDEAESLFLRALTIREKVFGAEHPDVATVLENYASLLRTTDKESDSEAEKLEARASAIRKKYSST